MPGYQLSASGQHLPSTQAAAPIVRSWERCASAAADLHDDPVALRHGDLQERLEQHACVLRAAQPEIETLAGMVASASSLVLLADASGVILQASGNTGFLQRADHVALRPGVSWAENHRGTNAIGTALIEAAALRVHGAEHFLRRNQILSCHAAPIRSPRGEILGVLDISGDAGRMHAYALSLASMCARQVANRVIEQAGERCLYLVFHKQASLLDSVERGLLLIEDERIVAPGRVHTPQGAPFHAVLRQGGHARSLPAP
ncbi:sigma-54-dependent Fis family transcriptional regulator, partial [Bordetella pertussis]|uniref:sigma-54-dependent Fis family transcriptional regulator n=1 Tax=Bordetella pertussis TaxID=520 RepID=UPI0012B26F14